MKEIFLPEKKQKWQFSYLQNFLKNRSFFSDFACFFSKIFLLNFFNPKKIFFFQRTHQYPSLFLKFFRTKTTLRHFSHPFLAGFLHTTEMFCVVLMIKQKGGGEGGASESAKVNFTLIWKTMPMTLPRIQKKEKSNTKNLG